MGIEDIQISEELETNAPSIKYRGNEGPKSPQQMQEMMVAQLEEEYARYVDDMIEQGIEPMSMQQFMEQAMAEGQMSGGNPLPQDPTKPVNPFAPKPTGPVLPDRQMAAYGGIMGLDGRKRYGIGSWLKKKVRNIIPNELASVAQVAAPFIAPFNPLAAGIAGGLGSFDQTGSISKGLKSGLMNYGLGQGARYLGGAEFQKGINPMGGMEGMKYGFSKPTGDKARFFDDWFKSKSTTPATSVAGNTGATEASSVLGNTNRELGLIKNIEQQGQTGGILKTMKDLILDNKLITGLALGTLGMTALMGNMEPDEIQDMQRGVGLDIEGIRAEVQEAMADETGELLKALRVKYPFLGKRESKDLSQFAMGGRIGRAEGGLMDLGGMEKDYRAEGGFVPIGAKEKADDVPARLSVNEFVFTADAVRNAGGGDIDKGAEVMENMMKNLEAGGQVSEESQGMAGAQQMFETSERLSEVM